MDKVAVILDENAVTYSELLARVIQTEKYLISEGVETGTAFFACCENSVEYIAFYFAAAKLGAVVIPAAPSLTSDEMQAIIEESGALLLVTDGYLLQKIHGLLPDGGRLINLDLVDMTGEPADMHVTAKSSAEMPDRDFVIHYTSGTTGRPKGAIQTQLNHFSRIVNLSTTIDYNSDDITLCILSLMHAYGSDVITWPAIMTGQTVHLVRVCDAEEFEVTEYIANKNITVFGALPWHYKMYVESQDVPEANLSHMKLAMVGATQLTRGLPEAFHKKFNKVLNNSYGLTETGCICTNLLDDLNTVYLIGRPLVGIDMKLKEVAAKGGDNVGELLVASEGFARAYTENSTKEMWNGDWLETGDLVKLENGQISVLSRIEETFLVGDELIYAFDLEDQSSLFSYVKESAVVNVDGSCHLFLVPRSTAHGVTATQVQKDLETLSSSYKGIAGVHMVPAMPKSVTGKISKAKLANKVREGELSQTAVLH